MQLFGELCALGAAIIWAVSISLLRVYGQGVSSFAINLIRTIVALTCLLAVVFVVRPAFPDKAEIWMQLALSGLVGLTLADTLMYSALKRLGAQVTSAFQVSSPPMTVIIAFFFLGESLSLWEAVGIGVTSTALVGMMLVGKRQPVASKDSNDPTVRTKGVALALGSALANSIGLVLARSAIQHVDPFLGSALRFGPAMIGMLLIIMSMNAAGRRIVMPRTKVELFGIVLGAILGAFIGVTLLTVGLKYARAGIASALSVTYPIWILPIAHFILKERVRPLSLACSVVAVLGVVVLMYARL